MKQSTTTLLGVAISAIGINIALAADQPAEETRWKSKASAGLTLQKGNSDTLLATAQLLSERKWQMNEISLGASGSYGEDKGAQNVGSAGAFAQYNRLFSERVFGYFRADFVNDAIADIDYRVTLSPGAGYYFIKNKEMQLRGEAGPGLVLEKLGGVDRRYFTVRFAEDFNWQINDRARIYQSADFQPKVDDFADYVFNFKVGVETEITKVVTLETYLLDTYRSEPATGRTKNDVKLVAGVGYKF